MIRSFLTGQMVPVEQANRRPIAIMMSNDKEARPQYGMNRAGVVYEAPEMCIRDRVVDFNEDDHKISLSVKALQAAPQNEDVADVDIDSYAK